MEGQGHHCHSVMKGMDSRKEFRVASVDAIREGPLPGMVSVDYTIPEELRGQRLWMTFDLEHHLISFDYPPLDYSLA